MQHPRQPSFTPHRQPVIVIGAGVGGLVAALELAHRGVEVLVCEAAAQPGGKMRQVQLGDSLQDAGPTVFTMRWVFEELFADLGETFSNHLHLHKLHTLARHTWGPGEGKPQRLDLFADIARSADAIGDFAGAAEARRYLAFCERARLIYQTLEVPFLRGSRPNPLSLSWRVGRRGVSGLARMSPFGSMWKTLGHYFHDPRLQQLFGRYATYCGSSPFMAPATLMLVAHVEQDGVWSLAGGMATLATRLAALASQRGAVFRYGAAVAEVLTLGGRARGVRLANGEVISAAAVVFNGDVAALSSGLLGTGAITAVAPAHPASRSLSAITWNLVAPVPDCQLVRHNVFFSGDSRAEFNALFSPSGGGSNPSQKRTNPLPSDPTVYVCAQDRHDDDGSVPGRVERLLCLVNAPATGDHPAGTSLSKADLARCEDHTFARLARAGLALDRNTAQVLRTTPADFNRLFPATGGALYGQASHGWMASFRRPGARSRLDGLYLAGGSTHPGPGVPMAALSGRQAAASVLADFGRT